VLAHRDQHYLGGTRLLWGALAAAVTGTAGLVVGFFSSPNQTLYSYLFAYAYFAAIAMGALLFVMTVNAMSAKWPVAIRRLGETIAASLVLFIVLFVPIALGLRRLYPWTDPQQVSDERLRALLVHKQGYLNVPFFLARAGVYLVGLALLAGLLWRGSIAMDREGTDAQRIRARQRMLSGGALPAAGLLVSFAAIDWLMSLTPAWYSTMYPLVYACGGYLAAIALIMLMAFVLQRNGHLEGVRPAHYYALGRLLLAFVVVWAYVSFFQLLLIWIGNKPSEVPYFLTRWTPGWKAFAIVLIVVHFVIPFFLLLSYRLKHKPGPLAAVAGLILAAHVLQVYWLVMPAFHGDRFVPHWMDLSALLAVGGAVTAFALWRLRGHALVPVHDPALAKAFEYRSV
jgi:hypothetical protein